MREVTYIYIICSLYLVNGNAVVQDGLSVELLKISLNNDPAL